MLNPLVTEIQKSNKSHQQLKERRQKTIQIPRAKPFEQVLTHSSNSRRIDSAVIY